MYYVVILYQAYRYLIIYTGDHYYHMAVINIHVHVHVCVTRGYFRQM